MDTHSPGPAASLALDFCGLKFASPIVLLSGCVGFGEEYTRIAGFSNRDAGAIVLKGTTEKPRLGNPPHRVTETPHGMINAIGLQNPGVDHVVRKILPTLDFAETRFLANVCGSTIEEYAEVTRRFDDSPIDAMEINISCPNVKEGGVQFGNYPDMSARVVAACRKATKKPLITKLSPNQTDIRENARLCIEAGSDGLAVINTISGMAIDAATRRPVIGNLQGGISGPAIKPIALLMVKKVYEVAGPEACPHHRPGRDRERAGCHRIHDRGRERHRARHRALLRSAALPEGQRGHCEIPARCRHDLGRGTHRFAACEPRGRLRQLARHFIGDIQPDCCGAADGGGMLIDRLVG